MEHSKLYTGKFLTCEGATHTLYGMPTLSRELAGEGLKSWKTMKNGQKIKESKSQKNQSIRMFTRSDEQFSSELVFDNKWIKGVN